MFRAHLRRAGIGAWTRGRYVAEPRAADTERPPTRTLIADALAPSHPFAKPICVASNYHAAIIVVILLNDAATATFISIIVPSIIVDPWTSRTKFDSDLSVSG